VQHEETSDNSASLKQVLADSPENSSVPTPNNPPWNSWTAVGIWLASVFFIIFFPAVFTFPYLSSQSVGINDMAATESFLLSDPTAAILQVVSIIPAHLLTLFLAWLVVTNSRQFSFRETLGWKMNGFKIWHTIALFIFFYTVAVSLTLLFGDVENEFEKMLKTSRTVVYLVAFLAVFTAPLVEEVVYRGLLYSAFQRKFGIPIAVFLVTLLFTAVHVPQYSNSDVPDYATILTLLIVSLSLTLIRVWTGNLLPCIILHIVFNGLQAILLILQPYLPDLNMQNVEKTGLFVFR
jgi:membrane protease YdiL (CAAX protease family)